MEVSPYNALAIMSIKQPFRANVSYFSRQIKIKVIERAKPYFMLESLN